jgi:hypothetical protein
MRGFFMLIVLIGAFLAMDAVAFDGRYRSAAWQQAAHQGQAVNNNVQRWLNKLGL